MKKILNESIEKGIINLIYSERKIDDEWLGYVEFYKEDFYEAFKQEGLDRHYSPEEIEHFIEKELLKRINCFNEMQFWRGNKKFNEGLCPTSIGQDPNDRIYCFSDGIITKLINSPQTLLMKDPVILSYTNILDKMEDMLKLSSEYKDMIDGRFKFLMNHSTKRMHNRALGSNTFIDTTGSNGYEIVVLSAIPDNTILFIEDSKAPNFNIEANLEGMEFQMDLVRSFNSQDQEDEEDLYFLKMYFLAEINIERFDKIVLYSTILNS